MVLDIILIVLKSILIGISCSLPLGPVALLTLQCSLSEGRKAGMACALGAVITDTFYSVIAVFAYSAIAGFLKEYADLFRMVGGLIVIAIGIYMFFRRVEKMQNRITKSRAALNVVKSALMGISNPGCFLWVITMFAAFKIETDNLPPYIIFLIIASICAGSLVYWIAFTDLVSKGKKIVSVNSLVKINKIIGIVISIFGLYFTASGLVNLFSV